jgi:hypothetical protein
VNPVRAGARAMILHREAGEGDRRRRWRGRMTSAALVAAPSTMLRMVPLARRFATEEEPEGAAYGTLL